MTKISELGLCKNECCADKIRAAMKAGTAYGRATPTLSAAMELPEVRALVEALGECKHITHKAYVAATMEAINAGPAHPLSKQMDVWRLRCMRAEERALAALAPFTEATK